MILNINNAVGETWIFGIILGIALILSIRRDKLRNFFPISTTEELKGLAILAVVLSHIGYFLVSDHRFLFPFSIISGVAVDLFLLLSGFGLTVSNLKKGTNLIKFYLKRLPRLFIPFWIILIVFFTLDFLFLKNNYSWQYILRSFLGIFTRADIYQDINSPLWYFTLILFYYLIYPIVFIKKRPWISALIIYLVSYIIVFQLDLGVISQVKNLYQVHLLAFPLGIFSGWVYQERSALYAWFLTATERYRKKNKRLFSLFNKILEVSSVKRFRKNIITSCRHLMMTILILVIAYTAIHSGVNNLDVVGTISIITTLAIFLLFVLKKFDFKLLSLFGLYSYEIYLLHWPILYRYDIFYKYLPAGTATALYLLLFLVLAWALHKLTNLILKRRPKKI